MIISKKSKKHLGQTGYTLHSHRLSHTGRSAMRSIKFPLFHTDGFASISGTGHKLITSIKSDSELVQGIGSIDSYIADTKAYSLINFWEDSLRAGVVFQPTEATLQDFLGKFSGSQDENQLIFKNFRYDFKYALDFEQFKKKILLSVGLRSTSKKSSLINCFKPEHRKDHRATQWVDTIFNDLFKDGKSMSGDAQIIYWREKWGLEKKNASSSSIKLTFTILPIFAFSATKTLEECLSERRKLLSKESSYDINSILGFANTFSAFSNYYGEVVSAFRTDNFEGIYNALCDQPLGWLKKQKDLRERLNYLSLQAKKLKEPRLATSYAAYRTSFGGKIQSWFSNYDSQLEKIYKQLHDHAQDLAQAQKDLSQIEIEENEAIEQRYYFLHDSLAQLTLLQKKLTGQKSMNITLIDTYNDLLSLVRGDLNWFYQHYLQTEVEIKQEKNIENRYKYLFSKLRIVPDFFGHSLAEKSNKYICKTIPQIEGGLLMISVLKQKLLDTSNFSFADEIFIRQQLNTLLRKVTTKSINTKKYIVIFEKALEVFSGRKSFNNDEVFYISQYSRQKNLKIIQLSASISKDSLLHLISILDNPFLLNQDNSAELVDYLETQKIITSWMCRGYTEAEIDISGLDFENFKKAKTYLVQFGSKIPKNRLSYFLSTTIFAELRGSASQFSRKYILSRAVVQPMETLRNYKLLLQTAMDSSCSRLDIVQNPHRWYISTDKQLNTGDAVSKNFIMSGENSGKKFSTLKEGNYNPESLFAIQSSKYQIQFLDRLIYQSRKWHDVDLLASDFSFILEQTCEIQWSLTLKRPTLKIKNELTKLYASIPFTISPIVDKKELDEKKSFLKSRKKYLGLDVGEYGLAWVIMDFTQSKTPVRIKSGFIFDGALRKIKDRANEIKDLQMKGTFSVPYTKLARVREQAITSIRNKVHDLVLKHGAKPIYEFSISNFETGSNKTTKIYRSVKTSDVSTSNDTDADRAVASHVWGKNAVKIGNHISAYATSYTCSECWQTLYELDLSGKKEKTLEKVRQVEKNIYCATVNDKQVYAYLPGISSKNLEKILSEELLKGIRSFARPPVEINEALSFAIKSSKKSISKELLSHFKSKRGNSALFICPFCLHISDADIQAAQNIAIRGYLKDVQLLSKPTEKTNDFNYISEVKKFSQNSKLPSVDLEDFEYS